MFFDNLGQAPVSLPWLERRPLIRACASIIRLKWLFSEIVATPGGKRTATPLGNRISPRISSPPPPGPSNIAFCDFLNRKVENCVLQIAMDSQLSIVQREIRVYLSSGEKERRRRRRWRQRRVDLRSFEYIKRETKLEKLIKHHRYRENVTSSNVTNSLRIDPGWATSYTINSC